MWPRIWSLLSYTKIFKGLPKMMNYLFPPKVYRGEKSTSHTLICPFPAPAPAPWMGSLLADFLSPKNCAAPRGPGHRVRGRENMLWRRIHESSGTLACAWLSCGLGMRPDISRESRLFANSLDQKKRDLGECPAPELHQHIPAWLTLAGGLCFSTRVGKQAVETWLVLFLTLMFFKLSFHRSGQEAYGKFPLT